MESVSFHMHYFPTTMRKMEEVSQLIMIINSIITSGSLQPSAALDHSCHPVT